MREMVVDMVCRTSKAVSGKCLSEQLGDLPPLTAILKTAEHELDLWRMGRQICDFSQALGAIVLVDSNMVYIGEAQSCFLQTIGDGLRGEPSPMLDPAKPLLFCGCYQFAITHERGRGIAVECINAENDHDGVPEILAEPDSSRRLRVARQPKIQIKHTATDAIPRKIPRHPFTAFIAHRFQWLARQRHHTCQSRSEGVDPLFDPPAAALALEPAPGRPFGGNYRCSRRERFRDRQTEILIQCREDKNVGAPVGGRFRLAVDRALDGDVS